MSKETELFAGAYLLRFEKVKMGWRCRRESSVWRFGWLGGRMFGSLPCLLLTVEQYWPRGWCGDCPATSPRSQAQELTIGTSSHTLPPNPETENMSQLRRRKVLWPSIPGHSPGHLQITHPSRRQIGDLLCN